MHLDNNRPLASASSSSEISWQWRAKRWFIALYLLTIFLIIGSKALFSLPGVHPGDAHLVYNFNLVVLLLCAIFAAFSEREWPVWKRVLWIIALWIVHGIMQLIPFGIIAGKLTNGVVANPTIVSLILIIFVMRRSRVFVEPSSADKKINWYGIW